MSSQNPPATDQAEAFLTEAYNLPDDESKRRFYARWASDYDRQMIEGLNYISPFTIAAKLQREVADMAAPILDIGCGTGLAVRRLSETGYRNLYGIDLSPDMVEVARSRGYYVDLKTGDVTRPLVYASDFFAGVISAGTFTHGHVGPEPLAEIHRILSPGGVLACTVHQDLWESRGFRAGFEAMEQSGRFERVSLVNDCYYRDGAKEGWFCVYRKL